MLKNFIFDTTFKVFSIDKEILFNKKRGLACIIKQYLCYWLDTYTKMSNDDIAAILEYNNRGSVSYNIKIIADKKQNNPGLLYDEFFVIESEIRQHIDLDIKISDKLMGPLKEDIEILKAILLEVGPRKRLGVKRYDKIVEICKKYKS